MSTNFRDIYTQWTQKQALLSFVMKSARCWAGYEPVPGKAPYSNDSCRPAGGKKKKKEPSEKKASPGQSVFTHVEKKHKEELAGVKPSRETSKHVHVTRAEPKKTEDLRAEAVFPTTRPNSD